MGVTMDAKYNTNSISISSILGDIETSYYQKVILY